METLYERPALKPSEALKTVLYAISILRDRYPGDCILNGPHRRDNGGQGDVFDQAAEVLVPIVTEAP